MGLLRVLSKRGDERVTWDVPDVAVGDPEALAAVCEAERIFNEARAHGATAFKIASDCPIERMERFDQAAEQIVMVPRVVGG